MPSTTPASRWCDATTARVVGATFWCAQLAPDGARARADLRRIRPLDPGSFELERDALERAETWWTELEDDARALARRALGELPELDALARRAAAGEPWRESDLFALKRWAMRAHDLCGLATSLDDLSDERTWLDGILDTIHPEARRTPKFRLVDDLDAELAEARSAWRASRRAARARRRDLEERILADYPRGRVELDGDLSLPDEDTTAAASDARLEARAARWRIRDEELAALESELERANAALELAQGRVRADLTEAIAPELDAIASLDDSLATLDLRLAKVRLKLEYACCWPERVYGGSTIREGADPRIDGAQRVTVTYGVAPTVVTGPNMGGKSSLLKLVGLCHWCLAHAMPAPAERAALAWVEGCVYIGSDEVDGEHTPGLSSFGREVRRLVESREQTSSPRIWLLDELGRGTHPDEGAELARDVVASLRAGGDFTWLATHFPGAAALEGALRLRIAGLTDEEALARLSEVPPEAMAEALRSAMDYRPLTASSDDPIPRDARRIARLLGLDV